MDFDYDDRDLDMDAHLTGAQAATYVGESKQLVRKWRADNKLHPVAYTAAGAPLYRLGDVLAVERDTRESPHSNRRAARVWRQVTQSAA